MKSLYLILFVTLFAGCQTNQEKTYNSIKVFIDNIKVVNTHEHHLPYTDKPPEEISFFNYKLMNYFRNDMISAGLYSKGRFTDDKRTVNELWENYEDSYNYSRATSYHAALIYGYRKLYDFDKLYLTREDAVAMEQKVFENYNNYAEWFDSSFKKCNFEIMLVDQIGNYYSLDYDSLYYALVFRINTFISHISAAAEKKSITDARILKTLSSDTISVKSLDDYITMMDSALEINISHKAVCMKNSLAYSRTIEFDYVSYDEAVKMYDKSNLSQEESKKLQDFMLHWFIEKSIEKDLPVQIHTGYLNGTRHWLDNGHPMKLLPLFIKYPQARFVLFHGGYPWTSEFVALGKNFPNVFLDLVWLPQISRTEAIRTLHEIFDCVPYNKISWGGDALTIEESAGSLEIGKEVIATVLTERMEKGWLSEDVAQDMARKIFRENAIDLYKLDKRRNIIK